MRNNGRERTVGIVAYPDGVELLRVLDADGNAVDIPEHGALLTSLLGERLGLQVGDMLEIEVLEGERPTLQVPVTAFVEELIGLQVHMSSETYHRLSNEEPSVSAAMLTFDPSQADELDRRIASLRDVAGISHMDRVLEQFREQSAQNIWVMSLMMAIFAATIAVGVVYNNARVALSSRSRDLASLRVMGFTQREIAAILIGELSLQVLVAIPVGLLFGRWMVVAMMTGAADPEVYRLPIAISTKTFAVAILLTLASAAFSAWLVQRKLYRLDLIGVLKTRE